MLINVLDKLIETKDIINIRDFREANKDYPHKSAGFTIIMVDGEKHNFFDKIPYETYHAEVLQIIDKWINLRERVTEKWNEDRTHFPEFYHK